MNLKIIGSGGAIPFPKPGCDCDNCKKALEKKIPYERICSSLFIYPDILIDTPEEVFRRLMQFNIRKINHVFYTHWHPDHTQGSRIFEFLARSGFAGKPNNPPVNVYIPPDMMKDFDKYIPNFRYYEQRNFIKIISIEDREPVKLEDLKITPVDFKRPDRVRYGFLIEQDNKKVMYAPCSVFNAKLDKYWQDLDILFLETGWHGPQQEYRKKEIEPWFKDHISFEENIKWLKKLKPEKMVLTHVEGSIHQTHDLMLKLTKNYPKINIAYDGMDIDL